MRDRLMGCESTDLNLLILDQGCILEWHFSMQVRALAPVHKLEHLIKPLEVSFYLRIVIYCTAHVVHLPVFVHSIKRR